MSYREERGGERRRSRSRSRSRDRRDRDRGGDRNDRERNDKDRTDRDREAKPKEKKLSRAQLEILRKERVALVKRITQGDASDEEENEKETTEGDLGEYENNAEEIAKLLGFGGFGTTKNKVVEDNHTGAASGAVSKHKERKYRQYMNRKAGFDRPLQSMP